MDLELVETSELLDELFKRFEYAIFAGCKGRDADSQTHAGMHSGCPLTCAGLATMVQRRLLDEWEDDCDDLECDDL